MPDSDGALKMKMICFSTQKFEEPTFKKTFDTHKFELSYCTESLNEKTAILAQNFDIAICFVNDQLNESCLNLLKKNGVKALFLRSAGYNHVDIKAARKLQIPVYRVPAYSPEAVAEHTVGLLMCLNRKIHKAYQRIREMNFSLNGLVGFNVKNKSIGIVGVGKIGKSFAQIMSGFGCQIFLYDLNPDLEFVNRIQAKYVSKEDILTKSDILSFHCPLTVETHHFINLENIFKLKKGVVLINTSRGPIIETKALIAGLKKSHINGAALDVYEFESELFFADHSAEIIQDEHIARLMSFPNVLITAHQGFLTTEALDEISHITLENILDFQRNGPSSNSPNKIC